METVWTLLSAVPATEYGGSADGEAEDGLLLSAASSAHDQPLAVSSASSARSDIDNEPGTITSADDGEISGEIHIWPTSEDARGMASGAEHDAGYDGDAMGAPTAEHAAEHAAKPAAEPATDDIEAGLSDDPMAVEAAAAPTGFGSAAPELASPGWKGERAAGWALKASLAARDVKIEKLKHQIGMLKAEAVVHQQVVASAASMAHRAASRGEQDATGEAVRERWRKALAPRVKEKPGLSRASSKPLYSSNSSIRSNSHATKSKCTRILEAKPRAGDTSVATTAMAVKAFSNMAKRRALVHPERPLRMTIEDGPLRILSIDGGGVKGLNPTLVLQAIDERLGGRPIGAVFDLICGTSIGGAMAMCVSLGVSIKQGIAILREMAEERVMVKSSSFRLLTTGSKMATADLDSMLLDVVRECGIDEPQTALPPPPSAGTVPAFFLTTCRQDKGGSWIAFVNSNYKRTDAARPFQVEGSDEWPLFERVRSAVAAPTFFPPHIKDNEHYVDAAIVANNPTGLAVKEAQSLWPRRPIGTIVSLGCGKVSNQDARTPRSGLTYWAGTLLSMPMEVTRVHKEVKASLPFLNPAGTPLPIYFRLEPPTGEYELDESQRKVLDAMCRKTSAYIAHKSAKIDRLAAALLLLGGDVECPGSDASRGSRNREKLSVGALQLLGRAQAVLADEALVRLVLLSAGGLTGGSANDRHTDQP
mmetsp:Transcript_44260/g.94211  ORF Transcript_44260/g.94211 Transcript_44260/m.94211 type:complete len:705 (-) Transcript_44260:252-2366(-)